MDLVKFKPYTLISGVSSVSITKNGVSLSKAALLKLGKPDYVRLLINEDDKQIAFAVAQSSDEDKIKCLLGKKDSETLIFRINNRDLLNKITIMLGCKYEDLSLRCTGDFFDDDKIMVIDLNNATPLSDKDTCNDE
jgi:hypothetical protein